jgi:hypothetical protein
MAPRFAVGMIKGSNPELFVVVGVDWAKGEPTYMSTGALESTMRKQLEKAGATPRDVDEAIEWGREHAR